MRYAQIETGQKLHLVYEPGEGFGDIIRKGYLSAPLCGKRVENGYRMTINVPMAWACKNCLRVDRARRTK